MAPTVLKCLLAFSAFLSVSAQITSRYETHVLVDSKAPSTLSPVTRTVTETVHKTHPIRVRVTSDVWITETTNVNEFMTVFRTSYSYFPGIPRTVTSVIRVTSTPVVISTVEVMVAPPRTMTSDFTSFITTTQTVTFWQSITHVSVAHSVETVPVWSTQTLIQEATTTVTEVRTTVVTSSTGYHQ